jgi:hypothetical protein
MLKKEHATNLSLITKLLTLCAKSDKLTSNEAIAMCDEVLRITQQMYEKLSVILYNAAMKVYTMYVVFVIIICSLHCLVATISTLLFEHFN